MMLQGPTEAVHDYYPYDAVREIAYEASVRRKQWQRWALTVFQTPKEEVEAWFNANKHDLIACAACEDLTKEDPEHPKYHIHLAFQTDRPRTFTTVKRWFPKAHIEPMKREAYYDYVLGKKEHPDRKVKKVFIEYNIPDISTRSRQRAQQEEFWGLVQKMKTKQEARALLSSEPRFATYIPQLPRIDYYIDSTQNTNGKRNFKRLVIWISGRPGSGKSYLLHTFRDTCKPSANYTFSPSQQLSGPTNCCKTATFDDWDYAHCPKQLFFNLLDNYNIDVDVKGGHLFWDPDYVVVTSVFQPSGISQLDKWNDHDQQQILRRISLFVVCQNQKYYKSDSNGDVDQNQNAMDLAGCLAWISEYAGANNCAPIVVPDL